MVRVRQKEGLRADIGYRWLSLASFAGEGMDRAGYNANGGGKWIRR